MNRRQIAHRDIKLESIALGEAGNIVLSNFIYSIPTHDGKMCPLTTKLRSGTKAYAAPESLAGAAHNPVTADMWSLGMLLFCLVMGRPPCRVADDSDKWFRVLKRKNKREMDEFWTKHMRASRIKIDAHAVHFRSLIEGLLEVNPLRRLQMQAVKKHPWVCTVCPPIDTCRGMIVKMAERIERRRSSAPKKPAAAPKQGGVGIAAPREGGQKRVVVTKAATSGQCGRPPHITVARKVKQPAMAQ